MTSSTIGSTACGWGYVVNYPSNPRTRSEHRLKKEREKMVNDRKALLLDVALVAEYLFWTTDWERGKFQPTDSLEPDILGTFGCEFEPHSDEPTECYGLGCQRGICWVCKEAEEYWDFCATPHCYYNNCGVPLVRRNEAVKNSNGESICYGCAFLCQKQHDTSNE